MLSNFFPVASITEAVCFIIAGRLREPTESLFYYDVADGLDFVYYNSSQGYTPLFDVGASATPQQRAEAQRVCTIDGRVNDACVYDYHATGNVEASNVAALAFSDYSTAQDVLGLFAEYHCISLCPDTVGWASGRAPGL